MAAVLHPSMIAKRFTSDSAADAGRRSAIARKRRIASLQQQVADLSATIDSLHAAAARQVEPSNVSLDARASVLSQIETLSKRLDGMLADGHPRAIESIARALGYLREQERVLAGRPLPGVLKPRPAKRSSGPGIDELPPPTPMF